jgi:glycerol transport system ATP-binding protein
LADQVVVMNAGEVLQRGTPEALFERPEHVFVGHFIGSPGMNSLPCTVRDDAVLIADQRVRARPSGTLSGELQVGVRPESLKLHTDAARGVPVRVLKHRELGASALFDVQLGPHTLLVKTGPRQTFQVGAQCYLEFPEARTHVYCDGRIVDGVA